jgi:hypothetical protein
MDVQFSNSKARALSFSRYLPIIYKIRKVKITESYHKFLGLSRSGDNMANSMILKPMSQPQYMDILTKKAGSLQPRLHFPKCH